MSLRDDINIPLVVVLGVTTGLIVAVAIIGTQAGYNYASQAEVARNYEDPAAQDRIHFGEHVWQPQREALKQPAAWADLNKTSVRIPIADAMRIMIDSRGTPPVLPTTAPAADAVAAAPTSQPAAPR